MKNNLSILYSALCNPEWHFYTIQGITFNSYLGNLTIDENFVEGEIIIKGNRYIIYMSNEPISEEQEHLLNSIDSEHFIPYTILRKELYVQTSEGIKEFDIILQQLPQSELLRYSGCDNNSIQEMLDTLEQECLRLNLSNLKLTENNILVCHDSTLRVFRYHTPTAKSTKLHIKELREKFKPFLLNDVATQYTTNSVELYDPSNGYIRFENSKHLFGFLDLQGNCHIKAKFTWADNFYEERAVVEVRHKVGVINTEGEFIIEPIFDEVVYDRENSLFWAKSQHEKRVFNYNGISISYEEL